MLDSSKVSKSIEVNVPNIMRRLYSTSRIRLASNLAKIHLEIGDIIAYMKSVPPRINNLMSIKSLSGQPCILKLNIRTKYGAQIFCS